MHIYVRIIVLLERMRYDAMLYDAYETTYVHISNG